MVEMKRERSGFGFQAIVFFHVGKEIVAQHQGDSCQQHRIQAGSLEDAIDGAALQVDLPRKLGHGHPALVEDGFDHLSDMEVMLCGHGALSFWATTRKKRGIYFLLDTQGYHTPPT